MFLAAASRQTTSLRAASIPTSLLLRRTFHASIARTMQIKPIPLRDDNYGYLIVDDAHPTKGVLVDPYDVPTCQAAAKEAGVSEIVANITTHHHDDHAGGNPAFAKAYPDATIYGGSRQVKNVNKIVGKGDSFKLFDGSSINVKTYPTPCHTQDSVAFFLEDSSSNGKLDPTSHAYKRAVFTGDTLFISGCGRFFEGTAEEMHVALNTTLAALPGDTVVMCGHEYTKANVAFSSAVLPNDASVKSLVDFVQEGKNDGVTTGVFTIDDEKKHNVFMRVEEKVVKKALGLGEDSGPIDVMAALREAKNSGKLTANM